MFGMLIGNNFQYSLEQYYWTVLWTLTDSDSDSDNVCRESETTSSAVMVHAAHGTGAIKRGGGGEVSNQVNGEETPMRKKQQSTP